MLPPLRTVRAGLQQATEALARELATPGTATPGWSELEWRLASAAAVAHGITPLLSGRCGWRHAPWQRFLCDQRSHVERRQQRIASMLGRIDANARGAGLGVVALKGSALHALGVYAPGERPMADIDLLVRTEDAGTAAAMLQSLGHVESYAQWKHLVFKPANADPVHALGEHCDTPINIELHVRIQERLPVVVADATDHVLPRDLQPGINGYASLSGLMAHLLLHAAGGACSRSLRLMHVHDLVLVSRRMRTVDWLALCGVDDGRPPWWALPPLRLVERYYPGTVPPEVMARLARACPPLLRMLSRRNTMTRLSCSDLWLHPLAGVEWSRSSADVRRYIGGRIKPSQAAVRERADMLRTQLWLQGQAWPAKSHLRRAIGWLARPVPRMDILYAVRAAMESPVLAP